MHRSGPVSSVLSPIPGIPAGITSEWADGERTQAFPSSLRAKTRHSGSSIHQQGPESQRQDWTLGPPSGGGGEATVCSLGPTEINDAVPELCLVLEAANTDRKPRPWSVSRSVCVGGGLSGGAGVSARRGGVRDATGSPDAGVWRSGVTTVRVEAGRRLGPRSEGRAMWPT